MQTREQPGCGGLAVPKCALMQNPGVLHAWLLPCSILSAPTLWDSLSHTRAPQGQHAMLLRWPRGQSALCNASGSRTALLMMLAASPSPGGLVDWEVVGKSTAIVQCQATASCANSTRLGQKYGALATARRRLNRPRPAGRAVEWLRPLDTFLGRSFAWDGHEAFPQEGGVSHRSHQTPWPTETTKCDRK